MPYDIKGTANLARSEKTARDPNENIAVRSTKRVSYTSNRSASFRVGDTAVHQNISSGNPRLA